MTVPRVGLAPDYDIAPLIIGGWQLSAGHTTTSIDRDDLQRALEKLVDHGFTTFDCADIYTGVEEFLGAFRARMGTAARNMQIHTKFVPDQGDLGIVNREHVERIIDRSLHRLRCERLDLVQFAWWDYAVPGWLETAGHLADLRSAGKIHHLGITNFDTDHLQAILAAGIPIVGNQVQYSAVDRRPERGTSAVATAHDVGLLCYGALAGGFLTDRYLGAPAPEPPLENRSLTKYRLMIDEYGGWSALQKLLTVLRAIADRMDSTIAAVAIRYVLAQPAVAGVIVGMRSGRHVPSVLQLFDFTLDTDAIDAIRGWGEDRPGPPGDVFDIERDRDGPHGRIMKYNLNTTG